MPKPTAPAPSVQVNFPVGQNMIKNGDIISFFSSHEASLIHRISAQSILFFTGSRIYHTGVALWVTTETGEKRLMLCEAVGTGRRLVNLKKFADHKMEVHARPDYVDEKAVEKFLLDGLVTTYGFWNLLSITFREFFGFDARPIKSTQVCSETAALAWQAGGMKFETTVLSPGKLRNVLSENGVPPTLLINPDAE